MEGISLERKIGQMIVAGFHGTKVDDRIREVIQSHHIGNVILFARNFQDPAQLYDLIGKLQRLALRHNGAPLLIAIDQEGGTVTRLTSGVTFFPGSMAIAAAGGSDGGEEYARRIGRAIGRELKVLGINMNLAPILDLGNNFRNPIIGSRAYGEDPAAAGALGAAFIRGMQNAGILAVAKHFPGQGNTATDTHLDICTQPDNTRSLENTEMVPFRDAIRVGVAGMITAHVIYPAFDAEVPATLSSGILTGLLRRKLGYTGLIITDCLEMQAIDTYYGTVEGAARAAAAGADLLLISHTAEKQTATIERIAALVRAGKIPESRIDDAVSRILRVKGTLDTERFLQSTFADAEPVIQSMAHRAAAREISRRSITMVRDAGLFPIGAGDDVLFITGDAETLVGVDEIRDERSIGGRLRCAFPQATVADMSVNPGDEEIGRLAGMARGRGKVVVCTYNAGLNPGQAVLIRRLWETNRRLGVIAMRSPHDIRCFPYVPNYALAYEYTPLSAESVTAFLTGEIPALGKCPVTLETGAEMPKANGKAD